jgi:hypothetical protein
MTPTRTKKVKILKRRKFRVMMNLNTLLLAPKKKIRRCGKTLSKSTRNSLKTPKRKFKLDGNMKIVLKGHIFI